MVKKIDHFGIPKIDILAGEQLSNLFVISYFASVRAFNKLEESKQKWRSGTRNV